MVMCFSDLVEEFNGVNMNDGSAVFGKNIVECIMNNYRGRIYITYKLNGINIDIYSIVEEFEKC